MVILHALGQCLIRTSVATIGPRAELGFALATRLIAERGRRFTRRHLTALFWPDAEEQKAAHSLSEALHRLRARGVPIESDPAQSVWIPRDAVALDVDHIRDANPADLAKCDFTVLPGFDPKGSPELADWADEFRHQLRVRTVQNLGVAMRRAERADDWASAMALAEHALRLDPRDPEALDARARAADALRARRPAATDAAAVRPPQATATRAGTAVREPSPIQCALPAPPPPRAQGAIVGREDELQVLGDAWHKAKQGRGRRLWIHGASGIGKTRLVRHFCLTARRSGGVVADIACDPGDVRRPLSTFMRLVPKVRRLPGAAGCSPELTPYLDRLTEYDAGSTGWPDAHDVPYMRACIERAVDELIAAVADEQPLVIALDNAQWMDGESARLIDTLTMAASTRGMLIVIVSCDPAPDGHSAECGHSVPIALGPLSDVAARALISNLVSEDGESPDEPLLDWLIRAGDGNPLRLEELVNHWRDGGAPFQLPPTLAALLKARVAALSAPERRVLQVIALLAQQATLERVERVAALDRASFLRALDALSRAAFLVTDPAPRTGEENQRGFVHLACRHDAVAQAAIAELSPPARELLHREIAAALEADATGSADVLWDRVDHWSAGNEPADVVRTTVSCARHLATVGLADAGATACRHLLSQPLTTSDRRDALTALARTLHLGWRWSELAAVVAQIRELDGHATAHDDLELCLLDARGQMQEEWEETMRVAACCASAPDAPAQHRVRAAEIAVKLATNCGRLAMLREVFASVAGALNEPGVEPSNRTCIQMMYHAVAGSLPLAEKYARALVRMSARMPEPSRLREVLNSASALARAGARADALSLCEEAMYDASRRGLMVVAAAACHRAANICLDTGDPAAAAVWVKRFAEYASPEDTRQQKAVLLATSRLAFHAGCFETAAASLTMDGVPLWVDVSPAFAATTIATAIATAVAIGRGATSVRPLLARVLPLHQQLEAMGMHDFVAFAVAAGYERIGENTRASTLLRTYLKQHRREAFPVPERFAAMVSHVPGD